MKLTKLTTREEITTHFLKRLVKISNDPEKYGCTAMVNEDRHGNFTARVWYGGAQDGPISLYRIVIEGQYPRDVFDNATEFLKKLAERHITKQDYIISYVKCEMTSQVYVHKDEGALALCDCIDYRYLMYASKFSNPFSEKYLVYTSNGIRIKAADLSKENIKIWVRVKGSPPRTVIVSDHDIIYLIPNPPKDVVVSTIIEGTPHGI